MFKKIFEDIDEQELTKLDAKCLCYKKNTTIIKNFFNKKVIGIIIDGTANMEKYDYNGNKTILEKLEKNSFFGGNYLYSGQDISIVATSDCKVLLFDQVNILKNFDNNIFTSKLFNILLSEITSLNIRIEILSKRSTKDKILAYFSIISKQNKSKTFILPYTYTDIADYLSVDRSAMMREIKKLKEEGLIETNGRKIKLFAKLN